MDNTVLCPCGSGCIFENCCGPYLNGDKPAPTAEALMRSRYTAYTLNDQAYVSRTWYSSTRPLPEEHAGAKKEHFSWLGLEVKGCSAGGDEDDQGTVEFVAHYQDNGTQGQMHEISRFVKEDGNWFYVDGQLVAHPVAGAKPGRNAPCFCGSGKKYKKCCGS